MIVALLLALVMAQGQVGSVAVGGLATWFDAPPGTAAAGPTLRELIGPDWRGSVVRVSANGRSVSVTLSDWCACGPRNGVDTLIDLDDAAFARLAPLSVGVIEVSVEWGAIPLPPTSAEAFWTWPLGRGPR